MEERVQPGPSEGQAGTLEQETAPSGDAGEGALPGSGNLLSAVLMAAGVTVLLIVVVGKLRRRGGMAAPTRGEHRDRIDRIRDNASKRDELVNLMVDVEELTRRFAAQLDNKAARLEALLAEADEKLSRLERAASGGDGSRARVQDGGPRGGEAPRGADPITSEVYRLADEGHGPIEIARQLDQHTGKVELILALRNA